MKSIHSRFGAVLASALLCFTSPAFAEPEVTPIAMSVGSAMLEDMDFSLRPGGVEPGTKVHVLVTGLAQSIVDVDADATEVALAQDSTGKDLLEEPKKQGFSFGSNSPVGPFPRVSDDGAQLILELSFPQTPAPTATSIRVDGSLAVRVATGTAQAKAPNVKTAGGRFKLAGHDVEVLGLKDNEWQPGQKQLSLKTSTTLLESVASWKILDPAGETISDGPNSTMTVMKTAELSFPLVNAPETVTIVAEVYEGMQTITVPMKLELGLGIE